MSGDRRRGVATGRNVLVVDDDADVREAVLEMLLDEGLDVAGLGDGQAALAHMRREAGRVDLVMLDARMPGLDGETFLRIRARDPRMREIPVIVFTADRNLEARIGSLPKTTCLLKPCARRQLISAVHRELVGDSQCTERPIQRSAPK